MQSAVLSPIAPVTDVDARVGCAHDHLRVRAEVVLPDQVNQKVLRVMVEDNGSLQRMAPGVPWV